VAHVVSGGGYEEGRAHDRDRARRGRHRFGHCNGDRPIAELEGFPCLIFDQNGNLVLADESREIWFASGKVYLRCEGQFETTPASASRSRGSCATPTSGASRRTRRARSVRMGKSQLTCIAHADPSAVNAAASGPVGVAG
jgi:hypothetical protein